jgi:protein-ribulosamine 3-kinase
VRRDFYNLYHVLNHAKLFAGRCVRQGGQAIERLLAELGWRPGSRKTEAAQAR